MHTPNINTSINYLLMNYTIIAAVRIPVACVLNTLMQEITLVATY